MGLLKRVSGFAKGVANLAARAAKVMDGPVASVASDVVGSVAGHAVYDAATASAGEGGRRGKRGAPAPPVKPPSPFQRLLAALADEVTRRKEMRVVFFHILRTTPAPDKENIHKEIRKAADGKGRWTEDTLVYLLGRATTEIKDGKVVPLNGELINDPKTAKGVLADLNRMTPKEREEYLYVLENDVVSQWLGRGVREATRLVRKGKGWLQELGVYANPREDRRE